MYGLTRAPAIDRRDLHWYNVDHPLGLEALRGRVVLLDFSTFCCVNCLHMLPTLRRVAETYGDAVTVISVHSPKFPAERDPASLRRALARHDIRHPVIHDPDLVLWDQYCVRAWPTLVLLGPDGQVVGQLSGEPDPDRLLEGIGAMVRHRRNGGVPAADAGACAGVSEADGEPGGQLRFPGKLRAVPPGDGERCAWRAARWAVADTGHHQIVLLDDDGAVVDRLGSGRADLSDGPANNGPANNGAAFAMPQGLAVTAQAFWVADTGNHALRRIDRHSGMVTTVAGDGRRGLPLRAPCAGARTALASPWDVEVLSGIGPDGDWLAVANAGTHQIAAFDPHNGMVVPLAGTGAEAIVDGPGEQAVLAQPSGLAFDADDGALYFVDAESSAVRRLDLTGTPMVETLVGRGLFDWGDADGPFAEASLQHPMGLARFGCGLVVADSYNHCLRFVDLRGGQVHTIADGAGPCGPSGPGGPGGPGPILAEPSGVFVAGPSRLMVSDTNNHRILEYRLDRADVRIWCA